MNKIKASFCWCVLKLDRVPRYGRSYKYYPQDLEILRNSKEPWKYTPKAEWKFQKWGNWGTMMLDRLRLYWPYIYHTNPDIALEDQKARDHNSKIDDDS